MSSKKWLGVVAVSSLLLVMISGCSPKAQPQAATVAAPAAVAPAAPVDTLSGTLKVAASLSTQAICTQLADGFEAQHPHVTVNVASGVAVSGVRAVQNGSADIGAVTQDLTTQQQSTVTATTVAMDGVAVIVNPANGVSGLTLEQLKGIYDGQITSWQAVGGSNTTIDLFTRERGAGARSMMQDKVMDDEQIDSQAGIQTSTADIRDSVSGDPSAIGYISMSDLDQSVKALAVQGVRPSMQTISNGSYAISRPVLLLTEGASQGLAKAFIAYVLSPAGQSIIAQMKMVRVQ